MRLLLDTHVALWWCVDDARLSHGAREAIADAERVFVSAASAWEIAIKAAIGRLKLNLKAPFATLIADSGFDELDVTFQHAAATGKLPRHHADPFDRLLIAQALTESLTIVSHDRQLQAYQVSALWI
jgi:PIN domain nuclease of toxin-antitoxin system